MRYILTTIFLLGNLIHSHAQYFCDHYNNTSKYNTLHANYNSQFNRPLASIFSQLNSGNLSWKSTQLSKQCRLKESDFRALAVKFKKHFKGVNYPIKVPILPYTKSGNDLYIERTFYHVLDSGEIVFDVQLKVTFENEKPEEEKLEIGAVAATATVSNIEVLGPKELRKPDAKELAEAINRVKKH